MNIYIEENKDDFKGALTFLEEQFSSLRTGRASAGLVDSIVVEAYGSRSPINQIASISVPDAKTIIIKPWDKTIVKEIEKAIVHALPNINPGNEGDFIRISMPALTEDNRKEIVKIIKQKSEDGRIKIRTARDKIKELIIKGEEDKEIAEDERFRYLKELDDVTSNYNDKIKKMTDKKEVDIMTI